SVGRVFLAVFFMAVSPVLSPENPLGVGLTATSNFNRDRDYAVHVGGGILGSHQGAPMAAGASNEQTPTP
ncbi:MAG: hypothetical protein M3680_27330, partial [Myxococcota bacterium]|nr:hypothetical protein [Myxococcota bacterium]